MKLVWATLLIGAALPGSLALGAEPQPFFRQREASQAENKRSASSTVVVNAASYENGISPGGLATVFGINLTSVSGTVVSSTDPWPTRLAGVTVLVNGLPAPIFSIAYANGQDQISFQVPYDTPTGPNAGRVRVLNQDVETANIITDSFTADPGIFMYQGQYAVALAASDYSLIGPNNTTFPGEILLLYTTGLGPISLRLADGRGAPSNPLAYATLPVDVIVDGIRSKVYFAGLAPGFVGLYQINFEVPTNSRFGNLALSVQTPSASSFSVTLPVQRQAARVADEVGTAK